MRIAVISVHGCPCIQPGGTDAGGMNVYVHEVYERMARLGHQITVYSRVHPDATLHDPTSYDLVHLPVGEIGMSKSELAALLPKFAASVAEHAVNSERNFDLMASHYWLSGVVGLELARKWSIPHVTSFHTLAAIKKRVWPDEDEPEIRFAEELRVAVDADKIVSWTKGEAEFFVSKMGVATENVTVVAPGVDTDFFRDTALVSQEPKSKRVLYVGRLDALKGVDLLIQAFNCLIKRGVEAELQIVGGGSADEIRRVLGRISELRLADRIKMPGVLPQSALADVYSAATCIVAPSFHETFGLAVLEAAACGTPAVAADVDGLRSIVVHGETGYLIRDRDPGKYADKISELIENDETRNRMSIAARARAESLSWDSTVANLCEVYERLSSTHLTAVPLR